MIQGGNHVKFGPPQPLVLPVSIGEANDVAVMALEHFLTVISTKGVGCTYPILAKTILWMQTTLYRLPPPHFMYDGVESDLDAALVLERVMGASTSTNEMMSHLIVFLRT